MKIFFFVIPSGNLNLGPKRLSLLEFETWWLRPLCYHSRLSWKDLIAYTKFDILVGTLRPAGCLGGWIKYCNVDCAPLSKICFSKLKIEIYFNWVSKEWFGVASRVHCRKLGVLNPNSSKFRTFFSPNCEWCAITSLGR